MDPDQTASSPGETRREFLTDAGIAAGSALAGARTVVPTPPPTPTPPAPQAAADASSSTAR